MFIEFCPINRINTRRPFLLWKKTPKNFMKESFCHGRSLDDVIMEGVEIIFLSSSGHLITYKIDDYY